MKTNKCKVCGKDKGRNKVYCSNECRYRPMDAISKQYGTVIAIAMVLFTGLFLIFTGINSQIEKAERAECIKWQEMSDSPGYYVTDWQVDQCEAVGEPLDI